ncbi:MAG: hypothetical protein IPL89_10455 [Acidobacteria bacterium]|nr:hypothetical protein [Acidobacteriota bacterium]
MKPFRFALLAAVLLALPASAEEARGAGEPVRVDRAKKPVVKEGRLLKEAAAARSLAVFKADSDVAFSEPLGSAPGPGTAAPIRVPALVGAVNIEGNVFYSLGPTTGYFTADRVANHRASGTSGTLRLELWATTTSPASGSVNGYRLGTYTLGTLQAGVHVLQHQLGDLFVFGSPPAGCYYMSLLLTEFDGSGYPYIDYVLFPNRAAFGGGSCSVTCTEDANTMCLLGGRYRVTGRWKNQYAGGAQANLSKVKLTDVTGAFWIADASTYEFMIRVNTATDNGRAWMSILTFTDVEFWVAVTDVTNGQSKEYHSDPGNRTLIFDPNTFVYP